MIFTLTDKSNAYVEITKICNLFYIFPCSFKYEKRFPPYNHNPKRVKTLKFNWLIFKFVFVIIKPRKKQII